MWVIGGRTTGCGSSTCLNDVWYSTDGIDWTRATANAQWVRRATHSSVVFDDRMWVIGGAIPSGSNDCGSGASASCNDVWYSTDGTDWTQATANADWAQRERLESVVFDSKMWVIGGVSSTILYEDVWSSPGGQWLINHQGTEDITYADISNSGCTFDSTDIDLNNSINSGNNGPCWLFPSLTFSISASSTSLDLTGATLTDTAQSVLTVTADAQFGYRINAFETQLLTSGSDTIVDFQGSYETPDNWENTCTQDSANMCGFGFTTDDDVLAGADPDRFVVADGGTCTTAPCYAAFAPIADAPGDIVGDASVSVENDSTIITYRASVAGTQASGTYQNVVVYIVTAQF